VVQSVVVILVGLSLWWASRGHWSSLALPIFLTLLGLILFLAGEPTPASGGDGDPMRLTGYGLLLFCGPWTLVLVAVVAWRRQRDDGTLSTEQ
jgi:4-amino-4-deoxy-L-arabinose transferase-like glycosyltransferase